MLLQYVYYYTAYVATSLVHLYWNELPTTLITLVGKSLSNPGSPILLSLFRLHGLVLSCFVVAICFRAVSAESVQHPLVKFGSSLTLNFDDLPTDSSGFGQIPSPYHHLFFQGLDQFNPLDPAFRRTISPNDYNCAVSKPNSLYGSGQEYEYEVGGKLFRKIRRPQVKTHNGSHHSAADAPYFTLHSLKVKPLDMPIGDATLFFRSFQQVEDRFASQYSWNVSFPAGFHDMLHVRLEEFTHRKWERIKNLEIWVEFENGGTIMDWEFCIDDIEVEFVSVH